MLYPNPSNGKFTIQIDNGQLTMDNEKMQVSVYNVVGERILSQSSIVNSQLSIDLGDVPNGFYLVQITSDKGDSSFKKLLISK